MDRAREDRRPLDRRRAIVLSDISVTRLFIGSVRAAMVLAVLGLAGGTASAIDNTAPYVPPLPDGRKPPTADNTTPLAPLSPDGLPTPVDTQITVRVVAHGAMVIGDDVGGARITITDVETGRLLASGTQHGEPGDQNQIMRTPRLLEEPRYSTRPSGAFQTTLKLDKPTLVNIAVQGPLRYPNAVQRASKTVLLIPGRDLTSDGIVLELNGFIVQVEAPAPGQPLTAKDDVTLAASIRTLSGSPVRPYSDWDSRKVAIYGEVLIGDRVIDRLQMFWTEGRNRFEAPFFVPTPSEAPDGLTVRVVAADPAQGNFGMGEAKYPVLPEKLKPRANR